MAYSKSAGKTATDPTQDWLKQVQQTIQQTAPYTPQAAPAGATPQEQYAMTAASRTPEEQAFYEDQQRRANDPSLTMAGYEASLPTGATAAAAMSPAPAPAPTSGPSSNDPFAAIGGGVQLPDGGWVPKNHPAAQQYLASQQATQQQQQSTTPGAVQAAMNPISNQALSDQVRTSYLAMTKQNRAPDANDPALRAQADAFSAGVERQRRNYVADQAERLGPSATGALRGQERIASERAGQAIGGFEAELVGREIQARRSEIMQSLSMLANILSDQDRMDLQRELAQLDAQLRRLGIETGAQSEAARLGENARQFDNQLGFNVADREAYYNNLALQQILG